MSEIYDAENDYVDITGHIGPLYDPASTTGRIAEWPMYSFDRPAYVLWNAIANQLHKQGWDEDEIKAWLQSKLPRWSLDGSLGDALEQLGTEYAKTIKQTDLLKV
jgi:hypothetical protein